jgi:hypothetical protein
MQARRYRPLYVFAAVAALGFAYDSFAGQEMLNVDSKARARIAREKVRMAAQERKMARLQAEQGKVADTASCGSQSIGNVDTHGNAAAAPREVFVFAPNAINIVGRGSC